MMAPKKSVLEKFQKSGLIGCLNESGVTSENYKKKLMSDYNKRKTTKHKKRNDEFCQKCKNEWVACVC